MSKEDINYIASIEEIVAKQRITRYNEDFIEIPGILVLSKKKNSIISQFLNPALEVVVVEENDFTKILKYVRSLDSSEYLLLKGKEKPYTDILLNLKKIKNDLIFLKKKGDVLFVDDLVFTSNMIEYHGLGMFSGKKSVFSVEDKDINKILNYISIK